MLFEEINKHITNVRILVGKSKRTEPIARRQESPNDIRDNKHRKRIRISFIKHPITQVVSRTS